MSTAGCGAWGKWCTNCGNEPCLKSHRRSWLNALYLSGLQSTLIVVLGSRVLNWTGNVMVVVVVVAMAERLPYDMCRIVFSEWHWPTAICCLCEREGTNAICVLNKHDRSYDRIWLCWLGPVKVFRGVIKLMFSNTMPNVVISGDEALFTIFKSWERCATLLLRKLSVP